VLDRLTSESTPQGSVSYRYDNASRLMQEEMATATMGYNNANGHTLLTLSALQTRS